MGIKVIAEKILVQEIKTTSEAKRGVIMPESSQKKDQIKGIVISVGQGKYLENGTLATPRVKMGETVVYNNFGKVPVTHDGKEYHIITETDIYFIEEN